MMDVAECPVCYQEFDRPLQLSCGHTVCAQCVDRMVNAEQQAEEDRIRGRGGVEFNQEFLAARFPHPEVNRAPRAFQPREFPRAPNEANDNEVGGLGGGLMPGLPQGFHNFPPPDMQWLLNHPGHPAAAHRLMAGRFPPTDDMAYGQRGRAVTLRQRTIKIRCPECRSFTDVPANGLPVNYRLKEMIERVKKEKETEDAMTQSHFSMICCECEKEVEKGIYFICGSCPDKTRICSLCIVRLHIKHGDQILERKALTEQDLTDRLEKVNQHAALAAQHSINIGNIIDRLSDCGTDLKEVLEQSQKAFGTVSQSLRQINRSSTLEEADSHVAAAIEIADIFKQVEKKAADIRNELLMNFAKSCKEVNDKLKTVRSTGSLTSIKREIKGEPPEHEEDVVLIDGLSENTTFRQHNQVRPPLEDLFRRSPTPFPDEASIEGPMNNDRLNVEGSPLAYEVRAERVNRILDGQVQGEGTAEDALDVITNRARHIRVARTPSPSSTSPTDSPPRRRRRHEASMEKAPETPTNQPGQRRFPGQTLQDRSIRRRGRLQNAINETASTSLDQPGPSTR